MAFAAPIWLFALLPWSAVVAFLLVGRRRRVRVPFLALWRTREPIPQPKRRVGPPPMGLVLAMLAMLVALLGAARPMVRAGIHGPRVTVILDRGASMSAGQRYATAARDVYRELPRAIGLAPLDLVIVPAEGGKPDVVHTDVSDWIPHAESLPPTAVETAPAVRGTLAARRRMAADEVIVVVSDQELGVGDADPLTVQVAPERPVRNAGIALLAARQSPRAQVMVRVANAGGVVDPTPGATLSVTTAGRTVSLSIALPPAGDEADYFVDTPTIGPTVNARINVADDFAGDNQAWLVGRGSWPRLEPRAALPPALARMVETYAADRPAADDSPRVAIVTGFDAAADEGRAIVNDARAFIGEAVAIDPSRLQAQDHPITSNVSWSALKRTRVAAAPGDGGWTPIVRHDGRPLVAVRQTPGGGRQVWIGFESAAGDWARSPDFVVFWANVFDWTGGGGELRFVAARVGDVEAGRYEVVETVTPAMARDAPITRTAPEPESRPDRWPGLYRDSSGGLLAVNAPVARPGPVPVTDWRAKLSGAPRRRPSGVDLTGWFLAGAVALLGGAALAWPRRNLTRFSDRFTVDPPDGARGDEDDDRRRPRAPAYVGPRPLSPPPPQTETVSVPDENLHG